MQLLVVLVVDHVLDSFYPVAASIGESPNRHLVEVARGAADAAADAVVNVVADAVVNVVADFVVESVAHAAADASADDVESSKWCWS